MTAARTMRARAWLIACAAAAGLAAAAAHGHGTAAAAGANAPGQAEHAAVRTPDPTAARVELLDRELTDQDGRAVRFARDVVGGHLVAITVMYTSCTTVCPVTSAIFSQVQKRLGARLGDEVRLVSISVDPVKDSPQRLAEVARKHRAAPGWIWLTGNKQHIDAVLTGLGAYTPNFEDHPLMVLVGDPATQDWTRMFGFVSPEEIVERIDALAAARGGAPTQVKVSQ